MYFFCAGIRSAITDCCIKNYYMVDNLEDCFSITDFLRDKCESFSLSKCRDCHKCALDLYKNNKIKKII